ncbi:MAG: hypothetical protein IKA65_08995, partial [Lentisphaeria bacterium]|nr:hypothetical protein [Lentisphaeria bacterium]
MSVGKIIVFIHIKTSFYRYFFDNMIIYTRKNKLQLSILFICIKNTNNLRSFSENIYKAEIEVISKLLKSRQRHNLRPAQGVFSAVTFPPSHKAMVDKSGSHLKLPY